MAQNIRRQHTRHRLTQGISAHGMLAFLAHPAVGFLRPREKKKAMTAATPGSIGPSEVGGPERWGYDPDNYFRDEDTCKLAAEGGHLEVLQ